MGKAGFEAVQTQELWLLNQVTSGIKPLKDGSDVRVQGSAEEAFLGEDWIPAPGY
jgi:hypothetical protein